MKKRNENQEITQLANLQTTTLEAIKDYFISKMQNNYVSKPPLWDSAGLEGGLPRELMRRKAEEAAVALEEARKDSKERRRVLDERWNDLAEKQTLFRNCFIKFNKFVQENHDKRERAAAKLSEDTEALRKKTLKVEGVSQELQEMKEVHKAMEEYVQKHSMYEDYLRSVVEQYQEYKQPFDILNRFETLSMAKNDLSVRQERDLAELEKTCSRLSELTEDQKLHIMGLHTNLAELKVRFDKATYKGRKWELVMTRVKEITAQKQVEMCRVRDSLWAMYLMICKQKGIEPVFKKSDYENQLVVVMRALQELRHIVETAKIKAAKDVASDKPQSP